MSSKADIKFLEDPLRKYIQDGLNRIIKQRADELCYVLNVKYNADVLGIGDFISKHRPKDWEKLKKHWDDELKRIEVQIIPDVRLRRSGTLY